MSKIDPNGVGIKNGNIFGFPVTEEEADIVIIPVPWDATTSYGTGTSNGPQAILDASTQLDFYHPEIKKAWEQKIYMLPISEDWFRINQDLVSKMTMYHECMENGGMLNVELKELRDKVLKAQRAIQKGLKKKTKQLIEAGKTPVVLGGEHSTPLGLIDGLSKKYESYGILQFDAHADLRKSYEGLKQSHASIMFNSLKNSGLSKVIQVGVRDLCEEEAELIKTDKRVKTYFDWDLKARRYQGEGWNTIVEEIIKELPDNVYISFDIDGLNPSNCPNTGTPVPGGLDFSEAQYLLKELAKSGKRIIGFDLCEVAPGENDWDANVGARILWELCCAVKINQNLVS